MAHFIPTTKTITGATTVIMFLRCIFRLHILLDDIVSDRGPQFISSFYNSLCKLLGVQYKYYANQHHVQNPSYQIGDKVWLLGNNLQTSRPCANIEHQRFGPFTILAKINLATFKLQLPSTMRIHPIFHVSMLEPYKISPMRGERTSPSPPIEIDYHEEVEVEHYLLHWKGYDISDRTWEPIENLQRAPIKVQEFHKKNPRKPRQEIVITPHGTRRLRGR
ncbi:hypothetical protein KP509_28G026800 [Ceratopteris richardii]|uniref:Chromo domain-containing protein n=1 Tax=Ceratopteris richardii TaxID=49495 RepID=A0A8T2RC90_CERRI|nr:hypothetical protein KP509_28G026800 [Ceratopteris richardii]